MGNSTDDAAAYVKNLEGCCLTGMPKGYKVTDVELMVESIPDVAGGVLLLGIKYGDERRWAVVRDSQDYSGHG